MLATWPHGGTYPLHGHSCLHLGGHCIYTGCHPEPVYTFILLADSVFSIHTCTLHIFLLKGLLHFGLLSLGVLLCLLGQFLQLLCCKLSRNHNILRCTGGTCPLALDLLPLPVLGPTLCYSTKPQSISLDRHCGLLKTATAQGPIPLKPHPIPRPREEFP